MNIVVLYGSVRESRIGIKGARFVVNQLQERHHHVTLIDPMEHQLPLLNKMYKEYPEGQAPVAMETIAEALRNCDAVVVVSGEYNHSIPPALSNMIDHFQTEYFWKPAGIACYSVGGFAGIRAAMQLRAMLPEVGMPTIPSLFPIPKVGEFAEDGTPPDSTFNDYIKKFLDELEWYAQACKVQRSKGTPY